MHMGVVTAKKSKEVITKLAKRVDTFGENKEAVNKNRNIRMFIYNNSLTHFCIVGFSG